jgi:hypothetical protein
MMCIARGHVGLFKLVGLCGAAGLLAGCEGGVAVNYYDSPPRHRVVHVDHGHICSHTCHHYWSGGEFVIVRGHRHGPGCGHTLHEGRWIVVRRTPEVRTHADSPDVHIHRDSPDVHIHRGAPDVQVHRRVHPGPTRVTPVEHIHGPGCGHVYDRAGSKWVIVGHDHVHGPGCGHAYIEGRWVIRR